MTLDEYMELLLQRRNAWVAERDATATGVWRPKAWASEPLLEWFVRDGDESLVELPEPAPKPAPKPKRPRRTVDVEALIARRDKLIAERARVGASGSDDPAVVNLSPNSRNRAAARAGRRRFAQMDRDLARFTDLTRRIDVLDCRIARARRTVAPSTTTTPRSTR